MVFLKLECHSNEMERYSNGMGEVKRRDRRRARGELLVQASRREILQAAHRLFVERGYVATSIPAIAAEAGVAVQTIYNTVGAKREVLGGVIELAVRGPHYPATPTDTIGERIRAADDPDRILELLVDWLSEAHARTAAIYLAIRQAAAVDAEAAELEQTLGDERFSRYSEAARELARRGGLRAGLTPDHAAATIWSLGHPDTYRYLSQRRRWNARRYRRWLRDQLSAALRPPK
jgi:AcrR family transcriptional regulator